MFGVYSVINVSFVNNFTIGNFFRIKDKLPTLLRSGVIYWQQYHLLAAVSSIVTRVASVMLPIVGRPQQLPVALLSTAVCPQGPVDLFQVLSIVIRQHFINSDYPINTINLKIIGSTNRMDLRTIESIYIHRLKPSLNNHDSSVPLNILN